MLKIIDVLFLGVYNKWLRHSNGGSFEVSKYYAIQSSINLAIGLSFFVLIVPLLIISCLTMYYLDFNLGLVFINYLVVHLGKILYVLLFSIFFISFVYFRFIFSRRYIKLLKNHRSKLASYERITNIIYYSYFLTLIIAMWFYAQLFHNVY